MKYESFLFGNVPHVIITTKEGRKTLFIDYVNGEGSNKSEFITCLNEGVK